jgi:hypothetical protein
MTIPADQRRGLDMMAGSPTGCTEGGLRARTKEASMSKGKLLIIMGTDAVAGAHGQNAREVV